MKLPLRQKLNFELLLISKKKYVKDIYILKVKLDGAIYTFKSQRWW